MRCEHYQETTCSPRCWVPGGACLTCLRVKDHVTALQCDGCFHRHPCLLQSEEVAPASPCVSSACAETNQGLALLRSLVMGIFWLGRNRATAGCELQSPGNNKEPLKAVQTFCASP